jgi:hypothetical protein
VWVFGGDFVVKCVAKLVSRRSLRRA